MTSRETLALAAVALPGLTAVVVAVVPRRAVQPVAIAGLVLSGGVALALALVALIEPADLEVTDWVVIDAAAGLMVGVIGLVGLAFKLLWWALIGLVIGGLARLILPGRQNLSLLATAGAGVAAALLGGIVANALDLGGLLQFLVAVALAVALVAALGGSRFARA